MFVVERADDDRLAVYQSMIDDLVALTGFTISERIRQRFNANFDRWRSIYDENHRLTR